MNRSQKDFVKNLDKQKQQFTTSEIKHNRNTRTENKKQNKKTPVNVNYFVNKPD